MSGVVHVCLFCFVFVWLDQSEPSKIFRPVHFCKKCFLARPLLQKNVFWPVLISPCKRLVNCWKMVANCWKTLVKCCIKLFHAVGKHLQKLLQLTFFIVSWFLLKPPSYSQISWNVSQSYFRCPITSSSSSSGRNKSGSGELSVTSSNPRLNALNLKKNITTGFWRVYLFYTKIFLHQIIFTPIFYINFFQKIVF